MGLVGGRLRRVGVITDKQATWSDAGTVIQIQWNYGNSTTQGVWVARPGGAWRPSIMSWLASS